MIEESHDDENATEQMPKRFVGPQGTLALSPADAQRLLREAKKKTPYAEKQEHPCLLGINSPFRGQRFIINRPRTTIGRAKDNDIVLNESSVSAVHARLINDNGTWRVMNMLSTNGTFVNDKKITDIILNPGDKIRMGRVELIFDYDPQLMDVAPESLVSSEKLIPWYLWVILGIVFVIGVFGSLLFLSG